jgi:phospholipid-translocating ATPase
LKKDGTFKNISAADIKVGDIIKLNQNERVPADMILLYTTEKQGSIFLRTD